MAALPMHVMASLVQADFKNALAAAHSRFMDEFREHERRLADPAKGPKVPPRIDATRALQAAVVVGAVAVIEESVKKRLGQPSKFDEVLRKVHELLETQVPPPAPPPTETK